MLKDITLGQYYQTESVIHRLDPRVKLLGTILYFVSLFLFNNPVGYAIAIIFLATVIIIALIRYNRHKAKAAIIYRVTGVPHA